MNRLCDIFICAKRFHKLRQVCEVSGFPYLHLMHMKLTVTRVGEKLSLRGKGKSVSLQPRGAQRVPGNYGFQITWQWPRMLVRLSALRTDRFYPQEMLLVLISVRGWVDPRVIVRSEGLCQYKIPMTPSEIEPATFRFVAQHLNHCATAVHQVYVAYKYVTKEPALIVAISLEFVADRLSSSWFQTFAVIWILNNSLPPAFEDGTDTGFRNVGQLQFDAGEIPKRTFSIIVCFSHCRKFLAAINSKMVAVWKE